MDMLLAEYLPIIIFLGIAIGLGLVMMIAAWIIAVQNLTPRRTQPMNAGSRRSTMPG